MVLGHKAPTRMPPLDLVAHFTARHFAPGYPGRRDLHKPKPSHAINHDADRLHALDELPPRSTARSTITEPGRIEATISLEISRGAGRPGISAVVMTMSCFLMCSATSAACLAWYSFDISLA